MGRRTAKTPALSVVLSFIAEIAMRACEGLLQALPLLLVVGGAIYGCMALWRISLANPLYRIRGDTVGIRSLESQGGTSPSLPPAAVNELERLARSLTGESLLDPFLLAKVRASYEASPWIQKVCGLRRIFPNRVAIEFVLRKPFAQVRQGRYYWQIDEEGYLLPIHGTTTPDPSLPTIRGDVGERPLAGERWNDEGVQDALCVLHTLRESPLSSTFHIKNVLVRRDSFLDQLKNTRRLRPRIELETHENVTIRWGMVNRENLPEEILNDEKIAMLRSLAALDIAKMPGVRLDVHTRVPGYALPQN